jgi:hypothetical protein
MKNDVKCYLGYPPYNGIDNTNKRNPLYLDILKMKYGRGLPELLQKTGITDFGPTAPPAIINIPTKAMLRAIKLAYGVEHLYFWEDIESNWLVGWNCSTKHIDSEISSDFINKFERLIKALDGQIKIRFSPRYQVKFIDTGNIHYTLDSLREELLVIKLAGLLR